MAIKRPVSATVLSIVIITSIFGMVAQPATAQESVHISIDSIPDSRIVAGEDFNIHVSGHADYCSPGGATIEIYEKDQFNEDQIGEADLTYDQLYSSGGDFDTSVEVSLDEVGDGEMELQARVVGDCYWGGESARSNIQNKAIFEADTAPPDPNVVFSKPTEDHFAGETELLTAKGANRGGEAGEYSTVQIEFPSLAEQSGGQYLGDAIAIGEHNPTKIEIAPGDTVYNKDGDPTDADYWQYELSTDYWESDGTSPPSRWIRVEVTYPYKDTDNDGLYDSYSFPVNVRTTLTDDMDQEQKFTAGFQETGDQGFDVNRYTISVDIRDTDNDGVPDKNEEEIGTDPNLADSDSDGLSDLTEIQGETDPTKKDTDSDGLDDQTEVNGPTDPMTADSDNDGLEDGAEVDNYGTDPTKADTDGDGLSDQQEINRNTDPTNADTDDDGLDDGAEVNNYGTDPTNADTDGDGLNDQREINGNTDPTNADTDGDGVPDNEDTEPNTPEDIDGCQDDDGAPEPDGTCSSGGSDTDPPDDDSLSPIGDFDNPPTDPDNDGQYEDINGDGTINVADAQALFANLDTATVQNNIAEFDMNGDGAVNVADAQALFADL